jgi:hypothetical protein
MMVEQDLNPKSYNQWLGYRLIERPNGKLGKAPIDRRGRLTDCRNQSAWLSFADVRRAGGDGFGFVLTDSDPFVVIDIDNAVDHPAVAGLASYTEYSPSGNGLHIWLMLTDKRPMPAVLANVEVYATGFVTVTGKRYLDAPIKSVTTAGLYAGLGIDSHVTPTIPPRPAINHLPNACTRAYKRAGASMTDGELWECIFTGDRTGRIRSIALMGDTAATGETRPASSRERVSPGFRKSVVVLANALAHYLPGDGQRIERLIRETAIAHSPEAKAFDQRWDKRSESTWLAHMVQDSMTYANR